MKNKKYIIISILILISLVIIYNIGSKINDSSLLYVEIHGNSMNPTLVNGEKYGIKKVNNIDGLNRNDIVLFDIYGSNIKYIKRLKILPGDKYELSYEEEGRILNVKILEGDILKFKNYKSTKFYKTLLLWSNNTKNGWVKAPQCGVFGDNTKNSVDTLEYGFIGCNKISHKLIDKK